MGPMLFQCKFSPAPGHLLLFPWSLFTHIVEGKERPRDGSVSLDRHAARFKGYGFAIMDGKEGDYSLEVEKVIIFEGTDYAGRIIENNKIFYHALDSWGNPFPL